MDKEFKVDSASPEYQDMLATVEGWRLRVGQGPAERRLDANETAFITRELLYVKAKTYDVKYTNFKARDFIPVSHEIDPGAETWAFQSYDMFGMAKIIANYAVDFPRVDAIRSEVQAKIKSLGVAYAYTVQDMRRVAFASRNSPNAGQLDQRKAAMARRGVEAAIDDFAALGNTDSGITGFLNNAAVPIFAAPTGNWSTATSLEIIGDLNAMCQSVPNQSNDVEHIDTVLLPTTSFGIVAALPYSTLGDMTVASWFMKNSPYAQNLDQWNKLNAAGASSGPRAMAYRRDPEVVTLEIPQEFEQFAPQLKGMTYEIPCHARIAGVAFYYPLAAVYMDGI